MINFIINCVILAACIGLGFFFLQFGLMILFGLGALIIASLNWLWQLITGKGGN
jgi:hypothetical protein